MKIKRMDLPEGWYPKDKILCEKEIRQFIKFYSDYKLEGEWVGGVVPHAGWYYSGKLACQTINLLSRTNDPDVIVLFGGHLRQTDLPTYYDYDLFETPFGNLEQHKVLFNAILSEMTDLLTSDNSVDNSVEIQLPFIKYFFPKAKIVIFRSPPSHQAVTLGQTVAEQGKALKLNTLFIGSTDLTHYGPNYGFQPKGLGEEAVKWVKETNDQEFISHLIRMEDDLAINHAIDHRSACSSGAAVSCMTGCKAFGKLNGKEIDYFTSYDVVKNSSFVGYVGLLY